MRIWVCHLTPHHVALITCCSLHCDAGQPHMQHKQCCRVVSSSLPHAASAQWGCSTCTGAEQCWFMQQAAPICSCVRCMPVVPPWPRCSPHLGGTSCLGAQRLLHILPAAAAAGRCPAMHRGAEQLSRRLCKACACVGCAACPVKCCRSWPASRLHSWLGAARSLLCSCSCATAVLLG